MTIAKHYAAIKNLADLIRVNREGYYEGADDCTLAEYAASEILYKHPEFSKISVTQVYDVADEFWLNADFDATLGLKLEEWIAVALIEALVA